MLLSLSPFPQFDIKLAVVVAVVLLASEPASADPPNYRAEVPGLTCEFVQEEDWPDLIQMVAMAATGKSNAYVSPIESCLNIILAAAVMKPSLNFFFSSLFSKRKNGTEAHV